MHSYLRIVLVTASKDFPGWSGTAGKTLVPLKALSQARGVSPAVRSTDASGFTYEPLGRFMAEPGLFLGTLLGALTLAT